MKLPCCNESREFPVNEVNCHTKCLCHCFNGDTLIRLQELRIDNSPNLSHVKTEVWMQVTVQLNMLRDASCKSLKIKYIYHSITRG
ncbi:hypothetical protein HanPSC8_Chr09g0397541 [Helianthus annuus]|nr:hypothetical protein HanPSC8_Chr09g0397541 [Helianthus annuus]